MDMLTNSAVKDELFNSNQVFRDLVQKHQVCEKRLTELAHLNYPNEEEILEESTIKKKKLQLKDEIYSMLQEYSNSH